MKKLSMFRKVFLAGSLAVAAVVVMTPSAAHANLHSCVTRTVSATFSGTSFVPQTVCAVGEIAVSAGGFCTAAGDMKGASTTSGTTDRLVWLQCNQSGSAIWYGMCCVP
jgi:hypothetical protein